MLSQSSPHHKRKKRSQHEKSESKKSSSTSHKKNRNKHSISESNLKAISASTVAPQSKPRLRSLSTSNLSSENLGTASIARKKSTSTEPDYSPIPVTDDSSPFQITKKNKTKQVLKKDEEFKKFEVRLNSYQRLKVLQEILVTERRYVKDIEIIIKNYLLPLKANSLNFTLEKNEISVIFSNIETILQVNRLLLSSLEKRLEMIDTESNTSTEPQNVSLTGWDSQVSDIFLQHSDYFKLYTSYCKDHNKASAVLRELKKGNHLIHSWASGSNTDQLTNSNGTIPTIASGSTIASESSNADLSSLLIKPIQRICKYPLLLKQLLKYTDENEQEYEGLIKAFTKVQSIAVFMEESQSQQDKVDKMMEIQRKLVGFPGKSDNADERVRTLVQSHRKFLKEADLWEVTVNSGVIQKKERRVFLFNDILIICSVANSMGADKKLWMFEGWFGLIDSVVRDLDLETEGLWCFEICEIPSTTQRAVGSTTNNSVHRTIFSPQIGPRATEDVARREKGEWIQLLDGCIRELLQHHREKFRVEKLLGHPFMNERDRHILGFDSRDSNDFSYEEENTNQKRLFERALEKEVKLRLGVERSNLKLKTENYYLKEKLLALTTENKNLRTDLATSTKKPPLPATPTKNHKQDLKYIADNHFLESVNVEKSSSSEDEWSEEDEERNDDQMWAEMYSPAHMSAAKRQDKQRKEANKQRLANFEWEGRFQFRKSDQFPEVWKLEDWEDKLKVWEFPQEQ